MSRRAVDLVARHYAHRTLDQSARTVVDFARRHNLAVHGDVLWHFVPRTGVWTMVWPRPSTIDRHVERTMDDIRLSLVEKNAHRTGGRGRCE